ERQRLMRNFSAKEIFLCAVDVKPRRFYVNLQHKRMTLDFYGIELHLDSFLCDSFSGCFGRNVV
ncbi:MAG: hypothetical protein ACI4UN_02990, partial [Muribaculaceae bacterium]